MDQLPKPLGLPNLIGMKEGTIPLDHLVDVLHFARVRRITAGRTCQVCVLTPGPVIRLDCHHRPPPSWAIDEARQRGRARQAISPMSRGHIARLMIRVQKTHGGRETRKTWASGIRALLAEPQHTLNGSTA